MGKLHNAEKTCWNCPAAKLKGNVDFKACGQSRRLEPKGDQERIMIECQRRPELGHFEPSITFAQCPEWEKGKYGYQLRDMRVMILGIDGYLGWTLALKLGNLGYQVSGVDNFTRRKSVAERNAHSIVPVTSMTERLETAKEILDIDITFRELDIYNEWRKLGNFMQEIQPEAIVHYGEIPSAPYSMIDSDHAVEVQQNNVIGTLRLLFLMKEITPTTSLLKLGTMGEYGVPLTGRPLYEGLFPSDAELHWEGREWSLGGELTPRNPPSFYHVSKVQDTFNIYEACQYWWLRSYDIMQGVIYGVHTDEVAAHPKLRTRLDIDECFGTVINRFTSQAAIGMPLTVYGEGEQARGFIALRDTMECMVRLINSPPEPGQYDVVNQVSGAYRIDELAETVAEVASKKFGKRVKIQQVENPRVESEQHPLEVVSRKLPNEFGFRPSISLEDEITNMLELLTRPEITKRIEKIQEVIMPETRWSGEHERSEVIAVYEPGTRETGLFRVRLDTGKQEVTEIETKTEEKRRVAPQVTGDDGDGAER